MSYFNGFVKIFFRPDYFYHKSAVVREAKMPEIVPRGARARRYTRKTKSRGFRIAVLKKVTMPKSAAVSKKKRKKAKAAKGYWHFDHLVQGATEEKMGRIWDAFIDAVEKEGLICAGTYHPAGQCKECEENK